MNELILNDLEQDLEKAKKQYLRENGWIESSAYPSSYLLWSREIPASGNDRVQWNPGRYVMTLESAVEMQKTLDAWKGKADANGL